MLSVKIVIIIIIKSIKTAQIDKNSIVVIKSGVCLTISGVCDILYNAIHYLFRFLLKK